MKESNRQTDSNSKGHSAQRGAKVALVHDFLVKLGGAERVLKIFADLYPKAPIFTSLYDEKICGKVFPPDRVKTSFLQKLPKLLRKRYRYLLPLYPYAVESLDLSGFDLILTSSNSYAHGVLTPSHSRHVCYYHSPMRYAWDYTHAYLQEQNVGGLKKYLSEKMMEKIRMWDRLAADRVDVALAASYHVRQRIHKYYQREAEVLYPPVDTERYRVSKSHKDYFLIVSALTPFKRIDLAVQLFNKIGKNLVIIGSGSHQKYLQTIAAPNITFLGYDDGKLKKQYLENCRAFIMANEDDFGIAPVEAMACGKPVLAFGKGGPLETVIPGVTGEFFYEPTIEAMEDALGRLIVNEPKYDPEVIRKQAEQFSQKRFVAGLKKVLRTVVRA